MQVYLDKTGQLPEEPGSPRMRWGQMVEAVVGQWFAEQTGIPIRRCGILANTARPWQMVSLDFRTADGGILEIKNRGHYRTGEWDDGQVDDGAEAQGQHALAVTGCSHAWFAAQLGGEPPVIRRVERDDGLIADLTAMESEFWQMVQDRTPPALEGPAAPALVRRLFPWAEPGKVAEVGSDAVKMLREARKAQQEEHAARDRKQELTAKVLFGAGNAEVIMHDGNVVATCKNGTGQRPGRRFLNKVAPAGDDDPAGGQAA